MLKGEAINRNTETPPKETRETMPKTKSLKLLIGGPSKKCRPSFGEGHLAFVTDKKKETRNIRIWDIQGWPERLCSVYKGEGNWGGTKPGQSERGIKELVICKMGLVSALV